MLYRARVVMNIKAAKRAALLVSLVALAAAVQAATPTEALETFGHRRVSLNEGWRFLKGEALGAERPDFDDSAWRALDIPHDWAIEGPFDYKHNPDAGGLPSYGVGWYRKRFCLPASGQGRVYSVELGPDPGHRYRGRLVARADDAQHGGEVTFPMLVVTRRSR